MQEHDEDIRGSLGGKFESWEQAPPADGLSRLQADLSNRQGMPRWALWWPVAVLLLGLTTWLLWPGKGTHTSTELASTTTASARVGEMTQQENETHAGSTGHETSTRSTSGPVASPNTVPQPESGLTQSTSAPASEAATKTSEISQGNTSGGSESGTTAKSASTASTKGKNSESLNPDIVLREEVRTKKYEEVKAKQPNMLKAKRSGGTTAASAATSLASTVADAAGTRSKASNRGVRSRREQALERALAAERRKTDSLNQLVQGMRSSMLTLQQGMKDQEVKLAAQQAELDALVAAKEAQENQMAEYAKAAGTKAKAEDTLQKKVAHPDSSLLAEKSETKPAKAMKGRVGMVASGYYTRQHTVATSAQNYEVVSANTPNTASPERMAIGLEAIYTQPVSTRVQLRLGLGAFWQQSAQTLGITEGQLAHTTVSTQNNTMVYTPVHQMNTLNVKQQYAHVMGSAGLLYKPWADGGFYLHGGVAAYYQAWSQQRVLHNGNGLTTADVERLYGAAPNQYMNMSLQGGLGYEMPFGRGHRLAFEPEYRFMLAPQTFGNRMVQTTPHFMGIKVVYGW